MALVVSAMIAAFSAVIKIIRPCCSFTKTRMKKLYSAEEKLLMSLMEEVERKRKEAVDRDEIINPEISYWLKTSQFLLYELKHQSPRGCFSSLCWKEIREVGILDDELGYAIKRAPNERVSYARPSIANLHNFKMTSSVETALDKVMEALKDGSVSVVGVYGIPGVGKTTLVKRVAFKAMENMLFNRMVFLTVSASPDLEKIQEEVAVQLGFTLPTYGDKEMKADLIERKIREKMTLIILDDIWMELDMRSIGIPSRIGLRECNSKIVFTTRDAHVCFVMGCQAKIGLEIWSKLESREFLKKTAGTNFTVSSDFEQIADSVADECKGVPLALVAVAKALGDKSMPQWKVALERLRRSIPPNRDYDPIVFRTIKTSFDFLTHEEKKCFLMCCLFPEDCSISKEELMRYMIGVGLFPGASTIDEARDWVDMIVQKLKSSGLLLLGDHEKEFAKMHDVIRDVAIQIASDDQGHSSYTEEKQVFIVRTKNDEPQLWPLKDSYEIYTAISLMSNSELRLSGSPNCPRLQTLLLQDNHVTEIEDAFFENINALQVLNLSGTNSSSLPPSIAHLKMLRTLNLDRCKVTNVSVLEKLEKLTILSLRESVIEEVPESMGNLGNLRMLDLTLSHNIKRIPPNVFSRMEFLEELYLRGSFAEWRNDADQETINSASFSELIKLRRLTILEVDIANSQSLPREVDFNEARNWMKFNICVCQDSDTRKKNVPSSKRNIYSMNLFLDTSVKNLPTWFNEGISKRTEKLTYSNRDGIDLLEELNIGGFSSLKSLTADKFISKHDFKSWDGTINSNKPVFEHLQELQVYNAGILGTCTQHPPYGSFKDLDLFEVQCYEHFRSLKSVTVIKCENMRSIFSVSIISSFMQLEDLWVEECGQVERIIRDDEGEINPQGIKLPNLKALCLLKLPNLVTFYSSNAISNCPELKYLHVLQCPVFRTSELHSSKEVHLNDEHHMKALRKRMTKEYY